jgi:hypothetical protein
MFAAEGNDPSVTTILSALAKPALIGWAAREERKMVANLAGNLYGRLFDLIEGRVEPQKFTEMLTEELGKGAHRQLVEHAALVGSNVHKRIEWELKGEVGKERTPEAPVLISAQAVRSFEKWQDWRKSVNLKVIAIEKMLHSSLFGFGGTLDLLAEVDGTEAGPDPHDVGNPSLVLLPIKRIVVIDFKTGKSVYAEAFLQNTAYRLALKEEGIETTGGIIVRLPKVEEDPEFDAVPVPDDPSLAPTFLALRVVYAWWERNEKKSKPKKESHVEKAR